MLKKVLINFGPLKTGGGQTVALNFLLELLKRDRIDIEFYFVASKNSAISRIINKSKYSEHLYTVSPNPLLRIFQEFTMISNIIKAKKIDLIYTYFGYGFFRNCKQVIGSADSNIYFPEINFWKNEPFLKKFVRKIVDSYRIYGIKKSDYVIFENKAMFQQAEKIFGIKEKMLILPSINVDDRKGNHKINDLENHGFNVLILAGWQRNKNILLIPEICSEAKNFKKGINFIITASYDDSSCSNEFKKLVKKYNVEKEINLIGNVEKENLGSLYESVDCVLLLSKLESFSNNIIESWFYKKPLIISDEAWSRSICNEAAFYVERDNPNKIAELLTRISNEYRITKDIISQGTEELDNLPTISERVNKELNMLKDQLN